MPPPTTSQQQAEQPRGTLDATRVVPNDINGAAPREDLAVSVGGSPLTHPTQQQLNVGSTGGAGAMGPSTAAKPQQPLGVVCSYFMKGKCEKKDRCNYTHPVVMEIPATPPPPIGSVVCKFFRPGNCEKGSWCTYAHPGATKYVAHSGKCKFSHHIELEHQVATVTVSSEAVNQLGTRFDEVFMALSLSKDNDGTRRGFVLNPWIPRYEKLDPSELIIAVGRRVMTKSDDGEWPDDAFSVVAKDDGSFVVTVFVALAAGRFPFERTCPEYMRALDIGRTLYGFPWQKWNPLKNPHASAGLSTAIPSAGPRTPAICVRMQVEPQSSSNGENLAVTRSDLFVAQIQVDDFVPFDVASAALRPNTAVMASSDRAASVEVRQALDDALYIATQLDGVGDPLEWNPTLRTVVKCLRTPAFRLTYSDQSQPSEFIMRVFKKHADAAAFDKCGENARFLAARVVKPTPEDFQKAKDMFALPSEQSQTFDDVDKGIREITKGFLSFANMHQDAVQLAGASHSRDAMAHERVHFTQPIRDFDCLHNQAVLLHVLLPDIVPLPAQLTPQDFISLTSKYRARDQLDNAKREILMAERATVKRYSSGDYTPVLAWPGVVLPRGGRSPGTADVYTKLGPVEIPGRVFVDGLVVTESEGIPNLQPGDLVTVVLPLTVGSSPRLLDPKRDLPPDVAQLFLPRED